MKEFVVAVSLTSALLLALRDIFGRMAMRGVDPVVGTGATAFLGLPVLVAVSLFRGDFTSSPFVGGWPLGAIALAGILRIVLARTFLFSAMKRIGSARASSWGRRIRFSRFCSESFSWERSLHSCQAGAPCWSFSGAFSSPGAGAAKFPAGR